MQTAEQPNNIPEQEDGDAPAPNRRLNQSRPSMRQRRDPSVRRFSRIRTRSPPPEAAAAAAGGAGGSEGESAAAAAAATTAQPKDGPSPSSPAAALERPTAKRIESWYSDALATVNPEDLQAILGISREDAIAMGINVGGAGEGGGNNSNVENNNQDDTEVTFGDDEILDQFRILAIHEANQRFVANVGCDLRQYVDQFLTKPPSRRRSTSHVYNKNGNRNNEADGKVAATAKAEEEYSSVRTLLPAPYVTKFKERKTPVIQHPPEPVHTKTLPALYKEDKPLVIPEPDAPEYPAVLQQMQDPSRWFLSLHSRKPVLRPDELETGRIVRSGGAASGLNSSFSAGLNSSQSGGMDASEYGSSSNLQSSTSLQSSLRWSQSLPSNILASTDAISLPTQALRIVESLVTVRCLGCQNLLRASQATTLLYCPDCGTISPASSTRR